VKTTPLGVLKQYFGYDSFRNSQEALILDILASKDVLGIMPTGAGKSVCFQVPALMMDGLSLVVSPLISLMKDQVNALTQAGVQAAFINSSLSEAQIAKVMAGAKNGKYKIIYIAPERLLSGAFLEFASSAQIAMLAVDEAHCISQWGQDFRPSYSQIPEFIARLKARPIISAFTATATPMVQEDIVNKLALGNPMVLVSGFDRENLYFETIKPKNKFAHLIEFLENRKKLSGIVYCSTRNAVEDVCDKLKAQGYEATRYHAGLGDGERRGNQDDFLYDRARIMVATNAFGMGIDKSNVSYVVHYNMPKDIESYYQEAGRAGRDGEPATCLLMHGGRDMSTNLWLINNGSTQESVDNQHLIERNIKRLHEMASYCATNECLRGYILKYFNETPPDHCGNCKNCKTEYETIDITLEAQKIISCVARMKERYGMGLVIEVLRGKRSSKVLSFELDKLSTFGISQKTNAQLTGMVNYLLLNGYLVKTADKFPIIRLGARAAEVLVKDAGISMRVSGATEADEPIHISRGHKSAKSSKVAARSLNRDLFEALKERRASLASEQGVPAFVIFHDSTLVDMCMKLPASHEEFLGVSGVGAVKANRYAKEFLGVITRFAGSDSAQVDNNSDLTEFDAQTVEISDEPVTVSAIADRLNVVLMQASYNKVTEKRVNDWLVGMGYLRVVSKNNKNYKVSTDEGVLLGITSEERVIRGEDALVNLFSAKAQRFVAERGLEILGMSE